MSANPDRRSLLGLFAAAPIAAAAGGTSPAVALGRLRPGESRLLYGGEAVDRSQAAKLGQAFGRAPPLDRAIPMATSHPTVRLESEAGAVLARMQTEVRAIAALASAFPAVIAAPRSFGAPLRRRLYADLLAREAERLAALSEPPPTPPASPGPDA